MNKTDKASRLRLTQTILSRNKRTFLEYNKFRKKLFSELSPKDSEAILYLLPWLLSINHPACPGYLKNLKQPFQVHNIEFDKEIKKREQAFKKQFDVTTPGTLLKPKQKVNLIQGVYTIGSVGTVSQNAQSDCDIWVCFDKKEFDKTAWVQLNQKVNLIKGWLDNYIQLPAYFFISDVQAVKKGKFGSVDAESSGSAQQNVLKEEFYRTFILIGGKIPLWWLVYDKSEKFDYNEALAAVSAHDFWEYDIIDLGNLENIKSSEYFGAALWQFQKFQSSPLKSIVKMVLLKMLLEAPQERLICHQLREEVLSRTNFTLFPDHSVFTLSKILTNYKGRKKELMNFLKMCFYVRCEIKPFGRKGSLKTKLTDNFFKHFPLDRESISALQRFAHWKYEDQIEFGNRLFKFMLQLYREISTDHEAVSSESDKRDLTILGRKITVCYLKKKNKLPILQKPTPELNLSILTFNLNDEEWQIFSGDDTSSPIFSSKNIIHNISFIVWNGLFMENWIRMRPNHSGITRREIINLANRIRDFFGSYEILDTDLANYFKEEQIAKMLIIMGFDKSPWNGHPNDYSNEYSIVYLNNWGELFTRRFDSTKRFETFLRDACRENKDIIISRYLRRNASSFDKNIEIPKKFFFSTIEI